MMKIALAQLNYHIGNFKGNLQKMRKALEEAAANGAELVIFAELAVCGYPPRDFLEFSDFITRSRQVVDQLAKDTRRLEIAVIVGAPAPNPVIEGKDLFNTAYLLADGQVKGEIHKALLPTYDIFDEYRYFEPESQFHIVEYKGLRIALTICEDLWNLGNENPLYTICPMDELMKQQPDLIINIAASPFHHHHAQERIHVLRANALAYNLPVVYVNHVGAQTELIFDGGSLAMDASGRIVKELPYFEETIGYIDASQLIRDPGSLPEQTQPKEKIPLMYRALVTGIRDYFRKLGFTKAILGLSGGIDSAVCLILATEALGVKNVRSLLMPSPFSSEHSITDSEELAKRLGSPYDILPIDAPYESVLKELTPYFEGRPFDVTEENLQARLRGIYLMALSNKLGYILLNTNNKSEAAVGYGTLYGDMCGGLSVIGDVYKTEVYELARWINRNGEIIPENILTKAPSAELRPGQTDQDTLPPYELLDRILYAYIEERKGPEEIVGLGFDESVVARVLKMVNTNEYKRYQTPPMLRVSQKAFGMGRRMPIVARYLS